MNRVFNFVLNLLLLITCNSCIVLYQKDKIVNNIDTSITNGITVFIDNAPRPLGSNKTTIEIIIKMLIKLYLKANITGTLKIVFLYKMELIQ